MTEITQELLDDLRAGKSEAYEQLYNQYYESVYTLTYGILQNYDDAQDAVQQTFIHVFRKLSTLKNHGSFFSWLMRIANNEALMILRKRKRTPVPDEDIDVKLLEQEVDEPMLPATMAERRDTAEQLRRMIEKLPYEQRETLVLYYYHQQKITEIAAIMDCSESTAKSRLRYARASVKKEVEQWEKKNGERFRGVVAAPFGEMFVQLLQKESKSHYKKKIWKSILPSLYTTSGTAGAFATAGSSMIAKIAAGAAACVIAAVGIAGIASSASGGNGTEMELVVTTQNEMDGNVDGGGTSRQRNDGGRTLNRNNASDSSVSGGKLYNTLSNQFVTLRSSPSMEASEIAQIPQNDSVDFIGYVQDSDFMRVSYNGTTGYVMEAFFTIESSANRRYVKYCIADSYANLRSQPGSNDDDIIAPIYTNSPVQCTGRTEEMNDQLYLEVTYHGLTGWVLDSVFSDEPEGSTYSGN